MEFMKNMGFMKKRCSTCKHFDLVSGTTCMEPGYPNHYTLPNFKCWRWELNMDKYLPLIMNLNQDKAFSYCPDTVVSDEVEISFKNTDKVYVWGNYDDSYSTDCLMEFDGKLAAAKWLDEVGAEFTPRRVIVGRELDFYKVTKYVIDEKK